MSARVSEVKDNMPDPQRRALLVGAAALFLTVGASPHSARSATANSDFLELSRLLTGRSSLDTAQATLLQDALVADDPGFLSDLRSLAAWISVRGVGANDLQRTLEAESSPLAALPRRIVKAWYTGVVGEGAGARCITFESSLMHQLVADKLAAPSYCYGPAGAWAEAPV